MNKLSITLATAAAISCQPASVQSPHLTSAPEMRQAETLIHQPKKEDNEAIKAQIEVARKEQTALMEELYKHAGAAESCSNRIKKSQPEGEVGDNLPGKVLEACSDAQEDPGQCIQQKMLEAGLGNQLLVEIKKENGFLTAVLGCVPKAEQIAKLINDPAFKAERQRINKQRRIIIKHSHDLPQSQTDWQACGKLGEKQSHSKEDKKAFWDDPTPITYGESLRAGYEEIRIKYACFERMDNEAKNNPEIRDLVQEASKNLMFKDSLAREKCKEFDDKYLAESAKLDRFVDVYVANPSPEARIAYLRAEMAKFYRLNACIEERKATSKDPK